MRSLIKTTCIFPLLLVMSSLWPTDGYADDYHPKWKAPPTLKTMYNKKYRFHVAINMKEVTDYWTKASNSVASIKYHRHRPGFVHDIEWHLARTEWEQALLAVELIKWGNNWNKDERQKLETALKKYAILIPIMRKGVALRKKYKIRDV